MNESVMVDNRDRLTGLMDAEAACASMGEWRARARGHGERARVHAMLLGLRRFGAVNLAYGEQAGDHALAEIGARLTQFAQTELDEGWIAARVSGDTFLLATDSPCSRERWQWLAEELAQAVSVAIAEPGGGTVRLSPRVALLRAVPDEAADRMLSRLSEALDRAQGDSGRRLLWVDGEISPPGRLAQQLEADLLAALDRDEIAILFQPQYSCEDGSLTGAEALARWQHPQLGRMGASALFTIAERADHVGQLSRHIARKALAEAAMWPEKLRLSLNVTAADLGAGNFAEVIGDAVSAASFPPGRLTLEITEQALLTDLDRSADRLQALVDRGIRVALDDFGAGFCNFRYLKLLPLHYLKLDRSMVEGITEDERDLAVLRGIIAMARALDLAVIAEGIENEDQRAAVTREGCATWQGFLGAQPMDGDAFAELAARG